MRQRLPWILFFVSLALNLSVVVGVLWVGHERILGPRDPLERVVQAAALEPEQQQALRKLREDVLDRRRALDSEAGTWSDFVISIIAEPTFDKEAVRWAMIERSQPWRAIQIEAMEGLHGFVAILKPEQREDLFALIRDDRDLLRDLFRPR